MKSAPSETDFLVVGAGVAGLRAAIELADAGRVVVLTKREIFDSATQLAQGANPSAISDENQVSLDPQGTLNAGDGLCNLEATKVLVEEGPERIEEVIRWGAEFDRTGTKLAFQSAGAHGSTRTLHAHLDSAGREILRALHAKTKTLKSITVREFEFSTDLEVKDGRIHGVSLLADKDSHEEMTASAVLLATGGLGQLYQNTTNPGAATGDGVAIAHRAGAEISDMEFIQFHPTALYLKKAPRLPLSEALRGEGAHLRNSELTRFMPKYHNLAELAPRDVVARAIVHELEVSRAKDPVVYLDLTHLDPDHLMKRFPRLYSTCLEYNIDITTDLIPIRPAAQYAMGGVRTDLDGRTRIAGLYAAGEAAATGVHGADRLPSNSLLEGLVFGARAGNAMRNELKHRASALKPKQATASNGPNDAGIEELIGEIQDLMWKDVGVVRTGGGLRRAIHHLETLQPRLAHPRTRRACEASNLLTAGLLVARSALAREESRGAHYRTDYPTRNDAKFLKHSILKGEAIRFA
ncbi:MAG TPA: L-aspartate oxidase [Terriglobales bacterium]|nr:L-aspartate oxidase [Terriglobales bacterium]